MKAPYSTHTRKEEPITAHMAVNDDRGFLTFDQ